MRNRLTILIIMFYMMVNIIYYRFAPSYECNIDNVGRCFDFLYYFALHGIVFYFAVTKYLSNNTLLVKVSLLTLGGYELILILFQIYLLLTSLTDYYTVINSVPLCKILSAICFLSNMIILVVNLKQKR